MPKKRGSGGTHSRIKASSTSTLEVGGSDHFEKAFLIMDSAITGAVIAGIHPSAFEESVSFWFLQLLSTAFPDPSGILRKWLRDLDCSLTPIIDSVVQFVRNYDGPPPTEIDAEEMELLIQRVGTDFLELDEFTQKKQVATAEEVFEWVALALERVGDAPDLDIELAFCLQYIKLLALGGIVHRDVYLIARSCAPELPAVYRPVLR